MRTLLLSMVLPAAAALAQQAGSTRGQDVNGYNVINSFESGYRFASIDGDLGKYRSDINYRNGIRLLGSNLTVNSKEGHGRFFDEIALATSGLGNDPYESSTLRVQKNGLYRYDMLWRMNEYYNPGLTIAAGRHLLDTRRRLQDHDLTLLPQSKFKFRIGYTRNSQDGPALSTIQAFDSRGDEFALFTNVRRIRNEYRVGGDFEFVGVKLHWTQGWDYFREDTVNQRGVDTGANPLDRTALTSFYRAEPYHGSTPFSRANLRTERKYFSVNGRITYAGGRRGFILDETTQGTDRIGAARNRQVVVGGNARRPVTAGDFSVSVFPASRLTVTNTTAVSNIRIDGDSAYREFNNASLQNSYVQFRFLGIRTVANLTDAQYRVSPWLSLYSGYHFSTREIRSIESDTFPGSGGPAVTAAAQENRQHAGLVGLRLKPLKPVTIVLDAEIGRAGTPFFPVSDRNYHALGGRAQYRNKSLLLSAAYREKYNANSVTLSSHSSRARNYSFDASWAPKANFSLDAGYSKLHLDTLSGIAFFASGFHQDVSYYVSNLHAVNLGARIAPHKRAELFGGYTITKDTGGKPLPAFLTIGQSFPLAFHAPTARVSLLLRNRLRWNFSWQYYHYNEDFGLSFGAQNYRAHTGYTSLQWAF